jgi:hypothetical protein
MLAAVAAAILTFRLLLSTMRPPPPPPPSLPLTLWTVHSERPNASLTCYPIGGVWFCTDGDTLHADGSDGARRF